MKDGHIHSLVHSQLIWDQVQDPKSNYLKVIKLIRYHLPPIVKHVLAPQNDFGMPKITWSNHKSFGIEENPPSPYGKNSQKILYFFLRGSLIVHNSLCQRETGRNFGTSLARKEKLEIFVLVNLHNTFFLLGIDIWICVDHLCFLNRICSTKRLKEAIAYQNG